VIGHTSSTLLALAALCLAACAPTPGGAVAPTGTKTMADHSIPTTASDLVEAVQLAERIFGQANASADDYRLVQARRLLAGGEHCSGTRCWQLTFKLARLIPTSLSARMGAGGELFFTVDVERGEATLTGHGE